VQEDYWKRDELERRATIVGLNPDKEWREGKVKCSQEELWVQNECNNYVQDYARKRKGED
jgi:hypothetical protein